MLISVPVQETRSLDDYIPSAGEDSVSRLREAAEPLRGARLVHLSSTAFGGGVAELLPTQIAIMRDLGMDVDWQLLEGSDDFFAVTKLAHNALQGADMPWNETMASTYLERVHANAERWGDDADFVIVHDPQPLAIASFVEERGKRSGRWVWRCHIDLSKPMEEVWAFYSRFLGSYDASIFTLEDYVHEGADSNAHLIPPSIDPLSPKNHDLEDEVVEEVLTSYEVDPGRPIVTQVSRFDPWKDPLGVMDAFRLAREHVPEVQLVMVGSMAHDDPEGWHYLELAEEHRGGDPDIHLLTNLQDVGALAVNAFQRASTVVMQKSIREGFGLTCTEGMWKERAVIAGRVGGLRLQIEDGHSGFLVDTIEEAADRLVELLRDREAREGMGKAARERVRHRFLSTREVDDHIRLLASLGTR
ncbi:MAG TPA: glycosyltransferase [Actinomycetota bacterium]